MDTNEKRARSRLKTWLRYLVPISSLATIAVLSLLPGELRPHTPFLTDTYEHVIAYFLTAIAITILAPRSLGPHHVLAILLIYAALLELCQLGVPERTASFQDFLASGAGAAIGVYLAAIVISRTSGILRS